MALLLLYALVKRFDISRTRDFFSHPVLDTIVFVRLYVLLCHAQDTSMFSEKRWTGDLWSNIDLLKKRN